MKRTISECIELINEKMENAKNNKDGFKTTKDADIEHAKAYSQLAGEILAYTDVLKLLETSHLLDQEKEIEITPRELIVLSALRKMANAIKEIKNHDIPVKDLVIAISESDNEIIKGWLNDN